MTGESAAAHARKPPTVRALQWLLVLVCAGVVAFTVAALLDWPPPPDPLDEYGGMMENMLGAALLLMWLGALAPASLMLLAIRLRARRLSWAALLFAAVVFLLEVWATVNDGLEGPGDGRPWLLAYFAAVLLLAFVPKSRAYLGLTARTASSRTSR